MKKIFFIGLIATTILTSCNNDKTMQISQSKTISFSNAFVNKETRSIVDPSFTTNTLKNFAVYGFTEKGQIFYGTIVNAPNWTYSPLQYWVIGNNYTFCAIAPADQNSNVSNVTCNNGINLNVAFTNSDTSQIDLLHAVPPTINCDETFIANPTKVNMTFYHQLSKVKFSFENLVGEGYNVKVTEILITNAYTKGTLIVGSTGNHWNAQTEDTLQLTFGNVVAVDATANESAIIANAATLESYNEKLMIPSDATAEYNVTFTVELLQGDVSMGTFNHSTTISGVELKSGYCYDFKASLTHDNVVDPENPMKPIEFNVVNVEEWNNNEIDYTLE